jgi:quercetin dioxygenase-like cupin family protein
VRSAGERAAVGARRATPSVPPGATRFVTSRTARSGRVESSTQSRLDRPLSGQNTFRWSRGCAAGARPVKSLVAALVRVGIWRRGQSGQADSGPVRAVSYWSSDHLVRFMKSESIDPALFLLSDRRARVVPARKGQELSRAQHGGGVVTTEPSGTSELREVIAQGRLVEYQPGSVVSRTLIKKPAGTVTAFAFDAGEGLSEHTAPYDALVLGVDGEAEISIAGVAHHVAMGQLLALPAGQPHAVKAATPFKMLLVMIRA